MDKNIEHQAFEMVAATILKKFSKHDFLSGKLVIDIMFGVRN